MKKHLTILLIAALILIVVFALLLNDHKIDPISGTYRLVRNDDSLSKSIYIKMDFEKMEYNFLLPSWSSSNSTNGTIIIDGNRIICSGRQDKPSLGRPEQFYFLITSKKELQYLQESDVLCIYDEEIEPNSIFRLDDE